MDDDRTYRMIEFFQRIQAGLPYSHGQDLSIPEDRIPPTHTSRVLDSIDAFFEKKRKIYETNIIIR